MKSSFNIAKYTEAIGRDLVSGYETARSLGADPNAKGAGIESAARKQLKLLLPEILDVGQGYIIDSHGKISKQIDLVIFERSLCPVFSINESPESTYYPCEGVVAAIEIKSRTGKREFMDSCKKANSVRSLRRRFKTTEDGKIDNPRRYGQIEIPISSSLTHTVDPKKTKACDILTGLITGELSVTENTLISWYSQEGKNVPDIFISLTGICAHFAEESNRLLNSRLGTSLRMYEIASPFSRLVRILYLWFVDGKTAPLQAFTDYFS